MKRSACNLISNSVRRGFTLIELIVVISILGMISVIGVQAITHLFEADARSTASIVEQMTREGLSAQFRTDVHNALSLSSAEGNGFPSLEIKQPENIGVTYEFKDSIIVRRVTGHARFEPRDTFRFENVSCRFESTPQVATLTLDSIPDPLSPAHRMDIMEDVSPSQFKIHAVIGHQLRYLKTISNSEEVTHAE